MERLEVFSEQERNPLIQRLMSVTDKGKIMIHKADVLIDSTWLVWFYICCNRFTT